METDFYWDPASIGVNTVPALLCPVGVTLKALKLVKHKGEQFRLVNEVSNKWESFGIRLDVTTNQLKAWRKECLGDAEECWMKVMGHWLAEGGTEDYPTTWEGLYLLLDDVECTEVARKLKRLVTARDSCCAC